MSLMQWRLAVGLLTKTTTIKHIQIKILDETSTKWDMFYKQLTEISVNKKDKKQQQELAKWPKKYMP